MLDLFNPLNLKMIRQINKTHRINDDSSLWPINNRFNVADRAINRLSRIRRAGLIVDTGYSYDVELSRIESEIVNNPKNL